jgi:DNA-binding transcriptional ArsR family regulator
VRAGVEAKNVLEALADPLRRAIIEELALKPASAAELAAQLDAPIEQVRYQVKRLRALELVTIHAERTRRGAIERTFTADCTNLIFNRDEVHSIPERILGQQYRRTTSRIFRDAVEAARTGALRNDERHYLVRIPLPLDSQGWREAGGRFEIAAIRLLHVREKVSKRVGKTGEQPRPAITGLLFFEAPGQSQGKQRGLQPKP